jgi:hypothetical protein
MGIAEAAERLAGTFVKQIRCSRIDADQSSARYLAAIAS